MEEQGTARYTSTGKCNLCGGTFGKTGMTRHLQSCRARQAASETPSVWPGMREGTIFHIVVAGRRSPDYWMHLEVPAVAHLRDLDRFLRRTWLECCGHMSVFEVGEERYYSDLVDGLRGRSMNVQMCKLLALGAKFYHEYDFGTPTELTLRVASQWKGFTDGKSIRVLARNDAPEFICDSCDNTATAICTQCIYEGNGWLCNECAREHACGEEMLLPVVNSPRMGMCGYTGPRYFQ